MNDWKIYAAIAAVIGIVFLISRKSAPVQTQNATPVSVSINGATQAVDDVRVPTLQARTEGFNSLVSLLSNQSSSRDARTVELNNTEAQLAATRYIQDTNYALADLTSRVRLEEQRNQFNYINQLSGDSNKSRLAIKLNTAGTIWGSQNASNYDFKQDQGFLAKLGSFIGQVTTPITNGLKQLGV